MSVLNDRSSHLKKNLDMLSKVRSTSISICINMAQSVAMWQRMLESSIKPNKCQGVLHGRKFVIHELNFSDPKTVNSSFGLGIHSAKLSLENPMLPILSVVFQLQISNRMKRMDLIYQNWINWWLASSSFSTFKEWQVSSSELVYIIDKK